MEPVLWEDGFQLSQSIEQNASLAVDNDLDRYLGPLPCISIESPSEVLQQQEEAASDVDTEELDDPEYFRKFLKDYGRQYVSILISCLIIDTNCPLRNTSISVPRLMTIVFIVS